jgi:translocation and assembly module TamB
MRKRLLIVLALVLLVPVATLAVLLYTPLGVSLLAGQLGRLEKAGIYIEGLSGTFSGPLLVERFELKHPRVHVVAHEIRMEPQLRGLLIQTISGSTLSARDVQVEIREADMPPTDRPPRFLPSFMRIHIDRARIDRLSYTHIDGRKIEANLIDAAVTISHRRLQAEDFHIDAERFDASGDLKLTADRPLGIELKTDGNVQLQPDLTVALGAELGGTLDRMTIGADIREPSRINAEGVFERQDQDWQITGKLNSPEFSLRPWLDEPPISFEKIALDVQVTREQISTQGKFTIPQYELVDVGVQASGRFADRVLYVQRSEFTLPQSPSHVHATGTLTFEGGPPDLDLAAHWTDLQWPLQSEPTVFSRTGKASLRGTRPYEVAISAEIDGPNVPTANGTAEGTLGTEDVTIRAYDLRTLGGSVTGTGRLQLAQPRAWTLTANAADIDSAMVHEFFPGKVSFQASGSGLGVTKAADFHVKAHNIRGTVRDEPLRGAGEIERRGRLWTVREANITLGQAQATLYADVRDTIDARWSVHTPALEKLIAQAHGAIDFSGSAQGKRASPHIAARLNGKHIEYQGWSAQTLTIDGDVDSSNANPSRLALSARHAGYGGRLVETVEGQGEGTALDHRISLNVVGEAQAADAAPRAQLEVSGKFDKQVWTASIATTQFSRGDPPQEIKIAEPATAVISRESAMLDNFCLVIAAGRLCAEGRWQRNGRWNAEVSGYEIPLATVIPENDQEVEYAGRIEGSAKAFGGPNIPWQGEAGMKISDAAIIYRPQGAEAETLNLGTGGMHLVALPNRIDFSFGVQAFADTYFHTNAHLTRTSEPNVLKLPLRGELRARAADANLLPIVFPEVDHAAGVVAGSATLGGTLERPEINGQIELTNGELDSYRANFALRDLDALATIDSNRLDFKGSGSAGEGRLEVDGNFTWSGGDSRGTMHLRGKELLVADLTEYRVIASPDLQFEIDPKKILVKGEVTIPSALVQPAKITGAVRPSADARYAGQHEAEREGRFVVQSDVHVKMGEEVRVDAFGLKGRIEGGVTTSVRTDAPTTGHGELRVAEGRYEAYGQEVEISRGQLIFDNAPLDDPGLDIEARRHVETVTVGLNVRGTLQQPRLTFFSDPTMPQTQIVSYLFVGKALNETGAGGSESATSTTDTLAMQGGGFLAAQLGRRIGIEEVGVENYINSEGEANPSLVLGKFLSPRLFISYGISLTESINTLKLRYTISDRWIFRVESGEAQSTDLEYMIERWAGDATTKSEDSTERTTRHRAYHFSCISHAYPLSL